MIFYHYTTRAALDAILAEGLTQGEAPTSDTSAVHAINLTTDRDPSGHGLDHGGHVVTAKESAMMAAKGHRVPPGTVLANKREVRLTLKLPSSDPRLKPWRSWSRKHCEPGYPERLERAGGATGRKAKTWWLYFGTIPPESILGHETLVAAPAA